MMLKQVGITSDGKAVLSGVFAFNETYGLPLPDLLEQLRQRKTIPCWISFYKEALLRGMKHKAILAKLSEAIVDSYGTEMRDQVLKVLDQLNKKASDAVLL